MASGSNASQPGPACDSTQDGPYVGPEQDSIITIDTLSEFLRENASGSLDAIISVARERNEYLARLKEALEAGDDEKMKLYARQLCGLPPAPGQKRR